MNQLPIIMLLLFFVGCKQIKKQATIDHIEIEKTSIGQEYVESYGKPLVWLKVTDPWEMVMGSAIPNFALYEKGQMIYKVKESKGSNDTRLREITLSKTDTDEFLKSLNITNEFYKQDSMMVLSYITDQPYNILHLNISASKEFVVYGNLKASAVRKDTPKKFLKVYDKLINYQNPSAKMWLPKKIEVIFWDYNYAPHKRPWIEGFPDLKSPTTIKHDENDFSVFIDSLDYDRFIDYFRSIGEQEAVEINGHKMAISYRLPLPNIK